LEEFGITRIPSRAQFYNIIKCVSAEVEKNGGRIGRRTAYATSDIEWLDGKETWKNLSVIGSTHREFQKGDVKSSEWHYYISSAPLSPEELLRQNGRRVHALFARCSFFRR
jgi:hypothetical protein